jgi:hypothetical protein
MKVRIISKAALLPVSPRRQPLAVHWLARILNSDRVRVSDSDGRDATTDEDDDHKYDSDRRSEEAGKRSMSGWGCRNSLSNQLAHSI